MGKVNNEFKKRMAEKEKELEAKRIENLRIYEERKRAMEEENLNRSAIELEVNENLKARIIRGNYFVPSYEIKAIIEDIFNLGIKLEKDNVIDTDEFCDVFYKINYRGKINDEEVFYLC